MTVTFSTDFFYGFSLGECSDRLRILRFKKSLRKLAQVFRRTLVCKMASTLEAEPFTLSFQLCFQTAGLMEAGILASNFLVCPRGAFPGAQALLTS